MKRVVRMDRMRRVMTTSRRSGGGLRFISTHQEEEGRQTTPRLKTLA
jgi:hypothetical protein